MGESLEVCGMEDTADTAMNKGKVCVLNPNHVKLHVFKHRCSCPTRHEDPSTLCPGCRCAGDVKNFRINQPEIFNDPGIKRDAAKPRTDLLRMDFILDVARVLAFGAKTYGPNNWKKVKHGRERYRAAILRHTAALQAGETKDPETGFHHTTHVACCAMFIYGFDVLGIPEAVIPCEDKDCKHCYPK